ncbi:MAG: TIGR03936 family radical SAM-associated protein [Oscillospiraceae bacterium]|jgi:radical SAM-linked protein|nr:TIGR03936 family radical SAM-associated protein [Oscillospiraceae bacterium]
MNKVRFHYSKTGKAQYISHLDLMSVMQRALLRAGIKLQYSEGFNPHPYLSVALPLSVGTESSCELMDVGIIDDEIPDITTISMPDGIKILDIYKPKRKFNEIAWVEVIKEIQYNKAMPDDILGRLKRCFSGDSIIISKRTKRGFKELDISSHLKDVYFSLDDGIIMRAKISAQNPALNCADLDNAIEEELKPDHTKMKRVGIYDTNMFAFK